MDGSTNLNDLGLIENYLAGDNQAFEALALRHHRRVFNICIKMLGNPEDAQDASQEVFVGLLRKISGFRGDSSFTTWLYRMATNHCLDRLRAKKAEPIEPETIDGRDLLWQRAEAGPEASALSGCTQRQITAAFQTLPPDFRSAVALRDIEGLSHKEIAEITGTNEGTVKSRISRGRSLLAKELLGMREPIET